MLTRLRIGPHRLHGVSIGGVYTSLLIPELGLIFDVGMAPRSFVGAERLLISHGHADHVGALPSLLGQRGLARAPFPKIYLPAEIAQSVRTGVEAFNCGQERDLELPLCPVLPGEEYPLRGDRWLRVFRTFHSVPSVGYEILRKVRKLKEEFLLLPPQEIAHRRSRGEEIFRTEEKNELAYATDTLIDVLDENRSLYRTRTLIMECTFLDGKKPRKRTREMHHIHLDEIVERAELFQNEHIVLMHFSQIYQPAEVLEILRRRLPPILRERVKALVPVRGRWPG